MDNVEIKKSNLEAAYKQADDNTKKLLATLFGDAVTTRDNRPVTERIKTFEDALLALGEEHPLVKEWHCVENLSSDLEAYLQLRVICAALNEGWEPQFTEDENRWSPSYHLFTESELNEKSFECKASRHLIMIGDEYQSEYAGLTFAGSYYTLWYSHTYFGSRLCLKSEELATYCGKQFIYLWAAFMLTPKK